MATRDEYLLEYCSLTPTKAAEILQKSRQAVSRGIRSEKSYFKEQDVARLYAEAPIGSDEARLRLRELIRHSFREFAERILMSDRDLQMAMAIEQAEIVWVIAPSMMSNLSYAENQIADLIGAVAERNKLKVQLFCESASDAHAFESLLPAAWFNPERENLLTALECRILGNQPFMVVSSPENKPRCFILAEPRFAILPPHESLRIVRGFEFEFDRWFAAEEDAQSRQSSAPRAERSHG